MGSKRKMIPHILDLVMEIYKMDGDVDTILDAFSGSTRVSQALHQMGGFNVISNDIAVYSKHLAECYLMGSITESIVKKIDHLNALKPVHGWFSNNYGGIEMVKTDCSYSAGQEGVLKKPWQMHVTRKLDAIRPEIDKIAENEIEKSILLTSLMLALDKVDNTLGHHVSYLNKWSKRSYDELVLKPPKIHKKYNKYHHVLQRDVFDCVTDGYSDLIYLDPPYGSSSKMKSSRVRYYSYYHLWTTVCLNDEPDLFGKACRREDSRDTNAFKTSIFEDFRNYKDGTVAWRGLKELIEQCSSNWVLLSYSNNGYVTKKNIMDLITSHGWGFSIREYHTKANVMADMKWSKEWENENQKTNKEYLIIIDKR